MEETEILANDNSAQFELNEFNGDGLKIEFKPSNRKKTKKVNIHISGEFSILNSAAALNKMIQVIAQYEWTNIYLKNMISVDLSAIQSLYKLKLTQESIGKTICLESEFPKEYNELVTISGFLPILTTTKLTA